MELVSAVRLRLRHKASGYVYQSNQQTTGLIASISWLLVTGLKEQGR